jgi:hypothetical protein
MMNPSGSQGSNGFTISVINRREIRIVMLVHRCRDENMSTEKKGYSQIYEDEVLWSDHSLFQEPKWNARSKDSARTVLCHDYVLVIF